MMINKFCDSIEAAVANVENGSTVLGSGSETAGMLYSLVDAVIAQGAPISQSHGALLINHRARRAA
jgi:hypothetical protein